MLTFGQNIVELNNLLCNIPLYNKAIHRNISKYYHKFNNVRKKLEKFNIFKR